MNRNNLVSFVVVVAALGIIALLGWHFFEIHSVRRAVPLSPQARSNEYLALDRWIQSAGITARTVRSASLSTIAAARERHIFTQSSLFPWTLEAVQYLARWIEEGGTLFLILDDHSEWDGIWHNGRYLPHPLLEEFGIDAMEETSGSLWNRSIPLPSFENSISFESFWGEYAMNLKDHDGITRLVQVNRGTGSLIVSANPRFLLSTHLDHEPNAHLAWALFVENAEPGNEGGWLFIRGAARTQGLWGSLFRYGNIAVVAVSALVLLVVGFWAAIPTFGILRGDNERPGKPLRERFAAEGRFLKRYGALNFYQHAYITQIKRRLAKKENLSTHDEITNRLLEIAGKTGGEWESRLVINAIREEEANPTPIRYREFPKMVILFRNILERI